jgi:hypothetical protein
VAVCLLLVLIAVPAVLLRAARAFRMNGRPDAPGRLSGRSL